MPLRFNVPDTDSDARVAPVKPITVAPESNRGLFRAAFNTDNDVYAIFKSMKENNFPAVPGFDMADYSKDDDVFRRHPTQFDGVRSPEEYDYIRHRLRLAELDREILMKGGMSGFGASLVAAMASPTLLMPGGAIYRSAKVGQAAGRSALNAGIFGAAAVTLQETALQTPANDRTLVESATGVALGTLASAGLGAALGGGLSFALKSTTTTGMERATMGAAYVPFDATTEVTDAKLTVQAKPLSGEISFFTNAQDASGDAVEIDISDAAFIDVKGKAIDSVDMLKAIEEAVEEGKAAIVFRNVGTEDGKVTLTRVLREQAITKLDSDALVPREAPSASPEKFDGINPAGIKSGDGEVKLAANFGMGNLLGWMSPTLRGYTNKYSQTVRNVTRGLDGGGLLFRDAEGNLVADSDIASRSKSREGAVDTARREADVVIAEAKGKDSNLPGRKDIMIQAANAIEGGLEDFDGPEVVAQVARIYQERVFKPYAEEAQDIAFSGSEHWADPDGYVPRVVAKQAMVSKRTEIEEIFSEYFGEKLTDWVNKRVETLLKAKESAETFASDVALSPEDMAKLKEDLEAYVKEAEDNLSEDAKRNQAVAKGFREEAKKTKDKEAKKALNQKAKAIEDDDLELVDMREKYGTVKTRETNLNKGVAAAEAKQKKLREAQVKTEQTSFDTMNGLITKGKQLLDRLTKIPEKASVGAAKKQVEQVKKHIKGIDTLTRNMEKYNLHELSPEELKKSLASQAKLRAYYVKDLEKAQKVIDDVNYAARDVTAADIQEFSAAVQAAKATFARAVPEREQRLAGLNSRELIEETGWAKRRSEDRANDTKKRRATVRGQITRLTKSGKDPEKRAALVEEEAELTASYEEDIALTAEIEDINTTISPGSDALARGEFKGNRYVELSSRARKGRIDKTRQGILAALDDLRQQKARIVLAKGQRLQKLEDQHNAIDPEAVIGVAAERRAKVDKKIEGFYASAAGKGIEFGADGPDIKKAAHRVASVLLAKMTGEIGRVPLMSTLLERGPELLRTMDIDVNRVWSNGHTYREFLERDLEQLSRMYVRTVGPDFEIFKAYGELHPFGRVAGTGVKPGFAQKIHEEFQEAIDNAKVKYKDKPARLSKELEKIHRSRQRAERDILALVDRIRHTRGIPDDPTAISHRLGRAALNLNTVRLMGNVVPASIADVARLTMKQGVGTVFQNSFRVLFTSLPLLKATKRELQYAAVGNDVYTHARLISMTDVFDDHIGGNQIERGLQFLTNIQGRVAGFDYWNAALKQGAGISGILKIVENLERVAQKGKLGDGERFLAQAGIGEEAAVRIWNQLTKNPQGATEIKGILVPNTAYWTDKEAVAIFRAALIRIADDTIVTPGLERPLLMDGSLAGRLIFQFRSFAFSSATKTLMHGSQELRLGNLNVVLGMAMSIGLGAMSWYIWSKLAGEKQTEIMENADFGRWLDEAIARSGLLGPLGEVLTLGQKIPGLEEALTFGDTRVTRAHNPYRQPFVDAFGPTVGLMKDVGTLATTLHDPNAHTIKAARRLLPWQNVFYLRNGINSLQEEVVEGLNLR